MERLSVKANCVLVLPAERASGQDHSQEAAMSTFFSHARITPGVSVNSKLIAISAIMLKPQRIILISSPLVW